MRRPFETPCETRTTCKAGLATMAGAALARAAIVLSAEFVLTSRGAGGVISRFGASFLMSPLATTGALARGAVGGWDSGARGEASGECIVCADGFGLGAMAGCAEVDDSGFCAGAWLVSAGAVCGRVSDGATAADCSCGFVPGDAAEESEAGVAVGDEVGGESGAGEAVEAGAGVDTGAGA